MGLHAEKLVVSLEKSFALPLEWGAELLKLDVGTSEGKAKFEAIKEEVENNMTSRNWPRSEIDSILKELQVSFGVLVNEANNNNLDAKEVIAAYDKIMTEVSEATIAGKLSKEILSSLSEKQKLLLLPTSNTEETAYQLKNIQELLKQYRPDLVGHFGLEVEVGHVDRKYPNPKKKDKLGKPVMEAKMTHPAAVKVMGDYLKAQGLSFDLIATNNGSGHGTEFDKETLTPKSQVGKISPFLTRELQKEAASFGASIAQHGTSGSDMNELRELAKAGVIKFNIATNYQQIILNVLSLVDSGFEGEVLGKQVADDQDALVSGLHQDARAKMMALAKTIKDNTAEAEVKETDTLFTQFLKLTYAWGVGKKKIKDSSTDKDIATVMAKEFKRVFGKMDNALVGLDVAASAIDVADTAESAIKSNMVKAKASSTITASRIFNDELKRLDAFVNANKGKGSKRGIITEAYASIDTFLSKTATYPTFGVGITTNGATGIHDEAQGGTSAGSKEPITLSAKNSYQTKELEVFNNRIKSALLGQNVANVLDLDDTLEQIGRSLKPNADSPDLIYAGPAVTATSMALVRALARSANVDEEVAYFYLYNKLAKENNAPTLKEITLPIFMAKTNDGGVHGLTIKSDLLSGGKLPVLPIQEFLFTPAGYNTHEEALRALRDVTKRFFELVMEIDPDFHYGAEAAIKSNKLTSNRQVLSLMNQSINDTQEAGMFISVDVAATEIYRSDKGYYFGDDAKTQFGSKDGFINLDQVIEYYHSLIKDFPRLISIEDGFGEEDFAGWAKGTEQLGDRLNFMGDDVFVTAPELVTQGVRDSLANAVLNKINQAGTIKRSLLTSILSRALAEKQGRKPWTVTSSHRSGEPANQDAMAIMAVAANTEFIKTTVGSILGGGQGREAKVNYLSMTSAKWNNRGMPLTYAGSRMLKDPQRGFETIVKEYTEEKIFVDYTEKNTANSTILANDQETGNSINDRVSSSAIQNPGGIDLGNIGVKAAPGSSPVNIPAIDFEHLQGITFQIIRMEPLINPGSILGVLPKAENEKTEIQQLAYVGK